VNTGQGFEIRKEYETAESENPAVFNKWAGTEESQAPDTQLIHTVLL
jgi:hypothetical protein